MHNLNSGLQPEPAELATMNAIAEVASRSLNLNEILNDALDKILDVMGMEFGGAYVLDDERGSLNSSRSMTCPGIYRSGKPTALVGSVVEQAALLEETSSRLANR